MSTLEASIQDFIGSYASLDFFQHYPGWLAWVIILTFLLLISLILIWTVCKAIMFLHTLFGNRILAETQVVDEGQNLNAELDKLEESINTLLNSQRTEFTEALEQVINKILDRLSSSLTESQNRLKKNLTAELSPSKIIQTIDAEEKRLGQLFQQEQRFLNSCLDNKSFSAWESSLGTGLKKITDSAKCEYILCIRDENLNFEDEDTFSVKLAKVARRAIRWAERRSRWLMQPIQIGKREKMVKVRSVPYRKILKTHLGEDFVLLFSDQFDTLGQISSNFRSLVIETGRVVRFNFETTTADLEEKSRNEQDKSPSQFASESVLGTLDRATSKIKSILAVKDEAINKFNDEIKKESDKVVARIRRDCDFADTLGEAATRAFDNFKKNIEAHFETGQKQMRIAKRYLQRLWATGKQKLTRAKSSLGLKEQSTNDLVGLLDQATIEFSQKAIPALYRRVFRYDPLSDEEFFVGRVEEINKMDQAYERWKKGYSPAIAIHGPSGSGKTSLVQCAAHRIFQKEKIFYKNINKPILTKVELFQFLKEFLELDKLNGSTESIIDIAKMAKSKCGKSVVIIEGIQHMLQRRIGGFQVIQEFLRFLVHTSDQFLWIVCSSELGWTYLDYTKNISEFFSFQIPAQHMDRKSLERVIMVRHDITGYELEFSQDRLPRDVAWRINRIKDKKEIQPILKKEYFDRLFDITEGNIFSSIYYWLCSAQFMGEQKIIIRFPEPIRSDSIRNLSKAQISTLLAVLQHGSLDHQLHSQVFRTKIYNSEGILSELEKKNIILSKDQINYFSNPIVIPTVIKVLKERNLVYK